MTRKQRGAQSERLVAEYLRAHGWPFAEAVGAGRGGSDVTGTPAITWEIKARRQINLPEFLRQSMGHKRHATDLAVLVIRPDGMGPATVDQWPAVLPLKVLTQLLRECGYASESVDRDGDPRV